MVIKEDYYILFGVEKIVFEEDLKKVYCKKVIQYYLDKNQGNKEVEEMFKKVFEVYEVFKDLQKCVVYDCYGYVVF